jgi:tRNA(fMet)-specific endonuclease VapC
MRYLLDTNIVSDMARNPSGLAAKRLERIGQHNVCVSIIVAAEARFGILRRASERATRTGRMIERITVVPFQEPADRYYAEIRMSLETTGKSIGANDLLIAAHALALDCTLVTDNEREFSRVPGLVVENWLR